MNEFDEEQAAELAQMIGLRPAARELGIPPSSLQGIVKRAARRGDIGGPPIPSIAKPPEGFAVTHNSGAYDGEGRLLRQYVKTRRDSGDEYAVPAGHRIKGESAFVDPDGRILAKWIKTTEGAGQNLVDALKEAFAETIGKAPEIPLPENTDDDLLTLYPLPDLHFGQYSWRPETGTDYDIKIAAEIAERSIAELLAQSRPSKHAVLLGLGDLFHANDRTEATPGHKHKLDQDGRWPKVYSEGAKLCRRLIEAIAAKHEEVEGIFLQGNHDPDSSVTLSVALSMFYDNHGRIRITENANIAWWRRFGKCLLAATHGHTAKPADLMAMTANDRAEDWGQTTFRHGFMGHVHHERAVEVGGMRIETFQAVTARDAYAASRFRSGRSMTAITFHRERGEIGRHRVNIGQ